MTFDPAAEACFEPRPAPGKYLADLYGLARQRLTRAGVRRIHGGGLDTYADPARFYSYRRDGRTGRLAALVWRAR
jgi:copper oxidase (laccase) domain-containing protein